MLYLVMEDGSTWGIARDKVEQNIVRLDSDIISRKTSGFLVRDQEHNSIIATCYMKEDADNICKAMNFFNDWVLEAKSTVNPHFPEDQEER